MTMDHFAAVLGVLALFLHIWRQRPNSAAVEDVQGFARLVIAAVLTICVVVVLWFSVKALWP